MPETEPGQTGESDDLAGDADSSSASPHESSSSGTISAHHAVSGGLATLAINPQHPTCEEYDRGSPPVLTKPASLSTTGAAMIDVEGPLAGGDRNEMTPSPRTSFTSLGRYSSHTQEPHSLVRDYPIIIHMSQGSST